MRLDILLTKKGFAESREKAKYIIKRGYVLVDNTVIKKPSKNIKEEAKIDLLKEFGFVGRGGYKIDKAANYFKINFREKVVADVGCSIGGFTDYALEHGAKKVYAIDIGDPLHDSLRNSKKVIYMSNVDVINLKYLDEKIDLCLIDVTFSPLEKILIVVKNWLKPRGEVLGLIKPPFEIKGKPKKIHNYNECLEIAKNVSDWASKNGYVVKGLIDSGLKGKSSNQQEFFIYLIKKQLNL